MTDIRLAGKVEQLGLAGLSDEFLGWDEGWLSENAPSPRLLHLGDTALLLDSIQFGITPSGPLRASFIEKDDFGLGREDSKHGIRFGQMILNGQGVHETPEFVALKPFDKLDGLKREWAISQYLNATFEDQHALLPLGAYRDGYGDFSLLTLYEHGIKTLDNVFWVDGELHPEALRPETIRRSLVLGMLGLGMMHGSRVVHHDAQAKNLAIDRDKPRFIDLEDAEVIDKDAVDEQSSIDKTRRDLDVFIGSTVQVSENKDAIGNVLRAGNTAKTAVRAYDEGVKVGRKFQNGTYIPNLEKINDDFIRDTLSSTK